MKTAYIFHDSFSEPFGEWYPWMKTILEGMGYLVVVPSFPTPAGQSYDSWHVVLKNYLATFDAETLFVGHGTGGLFALRLVEENAKQIRGLFLVAAYSEAIGNVGYDRLNKTFFDHAFDWSKIKGNAATIGIFAGASDPFVSDEITQHLAESLGTIPSIIPDGGHLNKASGFTQLTPVAQAIKDSLKSLGKSMEVVPEFKPELPKYLFPEVPKTDTRQVVETPHPNPFPQGEEAQTPQKDSSIFAAHTMYEDMSHLVNSNQGKVASSLLTNAREQEAVERATSPTTIKNIAYIAATIISILAVIGIATYLFQKYLPASQKPLPVKIASLIQAEDHQKIEVVPHQPFFILEQAIRSAVSQPLSDGTIRDFYYMTQGQRASFGDTLSALGIIELPVGLTDEFLQTGSDQPLFMHGISSEGGVATHFLAIRVNDYDQSFALAQQWEPTMFRDLGAFMNVPKDFLKTRLSRDSFKDELIANKNVRVLRYHKPTDITLDDTSSDTSTPPATASQNAFVGVTSPYQENDIMLAYFFLNEHTLVITDHVEIIPELLKRWTNSQIY